MFVDAERAREEASRAIERGIAEGTAGEPLLVRDLRGRPSYWLVPVALGGKTVGAVRIRGDGPPAAVEAFREGSDVAAMGAAEAARQAGQQIDRAAGESAGEPVLVHDGPPGREAWRIEVVAEGTATRWIFVTPGGVYERNARESRDETLE